MKNPQRDWAQEWLKEPKSNYINGQWVKGQGKRIESINPATNRVIGSIISAGETDVNEAVEAARAAFVCDTWKKMNRKERSMKLRQIARLVRDHQDELATLETLDNGKLYTESYMDDVQEVADLFDYYAGWTDKFYGEVNPVSGDFLSYTSREPVGVCGQIVPWNFPLDMAAWKMAPALAMGNTVVIKPSSITSFSLIRFFEIVNESSILPPGVLNLIVGPGSVGSLIARHMKVDKLAFTGSTAVGRKLVHDTADSNLKTISLELGGKSPNIIFEDAPDMNWAIERSYQAIFTHKGEKCSEPTRLLVQRSIYQKVLDGLLAQYKNWRVGDPFEANSNQGAQVSKSHFQSIMDYIDIGKNEGGKILCGGTRNTEGENAEGFFINPTIFYDCHNQMRISQEEIFGPVLTVIPFDTEKEAIEIANDSPYGLAAGFWTGDIGRSQRVANALQAGQIFINKYGCYDLASPFGGYKESGWGRECAIHSLDLYTKPKAIWYAY